MITCSVPIKNTKQSKLEVGLAKTGEALVNAINEKSCGALHIWNDNSYFNAGWDIYEKPRNQAPTKL